jgi:hypothetical protein
MRHGSTHLMIIAAEVYDDPFQDSSKMAKVRWSDPACVSRSPRTLYILSLVDLDFVLNESTASLSPSRDMASTRYPPRPSNGRGLPPYIYDTCITG